MASTNNILATLNTSLEGLDLQTTGVLQRDHVPSAPLVPPSPGSDSSGRDSTPSICSPQITEKKLVIFALDYDGCIFRNSRNLSLTTELLPADKRFLNTGLTIVADLQRVLFVEDASHCEVVSCSSRGSMLENVYNARRNINGLSMPIFKLITDTLRSMCGKSCEVKFNPLLPADVATRIPAGTSYSMMETQIKDYISKRQRGELYPSITPQPTMPVDTSKVTLLYSLMHEAASRNIETTPILFCFYDDRENDLLHNLQGFFNQHPDLIPRNVKLRMYYREAVTNENPSPIASDIIGTGKIDEQYVDTLIETFPSCTNKIVKELLPEDYEAIYTKIKYLQNIPHSSKTHYAHDDACEVRKQLEKFYDTYFKPQMRQTHQSQPKQSILGFMQTGYQRQLSLWEEGKKLGLNLPPPPQPKT
jgi:hypothetical protein